MAEKRATQNAINAVKDKFNEGFEDPSPNIANISPTWLKNNHPRLRPYSFVKKGRGRLSIKGAHKNLNNYGDVKRANRPIVGKSTPSVESQKFKLVKTKVNGTPLAIPSPKITNRGVVK